LTPGTSYTVYIESVTATSGLVTSSQSISLLTAPTAATSVATGSYSQTGFVISWSGAQGASSLTFRYNSNSVTVVNQASPYTLSGLGAGSTYSVSIDATNATATASSGSVNGFTTAYAPTGLVASNQGATSFAIAWSGAAGASSLTFYYNSSSITVPASQSSPYTISSLSTNTSYTVYITATTSGGQTTNSDSINTATIPTSPTTGIQMWLDSNDPYANGTLVVTGTPITTWYDKSGNGYDAVVTGGTLRYNVNRGIVFTGSPYYRLPDGALPIDNNSFTIYIILSFDDANNRAVLAAGSGSANRIRIRNTGSQSMFIDSGPTYNNTPNGSTSNGTLVLFTAIYTTSGSTGLVTLVNGQNTTTAGLAGGKTTQNTPCFIGYDPELPALAGSIGEILLFSASHDTTTRQSVEGYLAWKWGLQTALPTNHPYYSTLPPYSFINPVSPLLSGSQLWLDSKYPLGNITRVSAGTAISTWYDKSGNGYNATASGGTLTYNINKGVIFTGSHYYTLPDGAFPINDLSYSIYMVLSFDDNNNRIALTAGSGSNKVRIRNTGSQGMTIDSGPSFNSSANNTASNGSVVLYDAIYTSGNNLVTFVHGQNTVTAVSSGARNTQNTPNYVGYDPGFPNMLGSIAEILVFPVNHNTETRQFAEGYLAWKWGSQTSLPTNHPYYASAPTVTAPLTPYIPRAFSGVGGIQLWFDASDPLASPTGVSNVRFVTTWYDKSGYDSNAPVSGTVPYNSATGALTFNGSSYFPLPVRSWPFGNSPWSIYIISNIASGAATVLGWGDNSGTAYGVRILFDNGTNTMRLYPELTSTDTYTNGQNILFAGLFDSVTGREYLNLNGGILNGPANVGTRTVSVTTGNIGADNSTNSRLTGSISEIQVYNTYHTETQRQRVEGYLAWKWGLQSSLPSGHPYKSAAPPTKLRTLPESMPGLALWFDASDPLATGTGVSNNTTISTWYDKSGNNQNVPATGNILYNSTTGGLAFNGASYFSLVARSFPFGNSPFTIYIMADITSGDSTILNWGDYGASSNNVRVLLDNGSKSILSYPGLASTDKYTNGQPFLFTLSFDYLTGNEYLNLNGGVLNGPAYIGTRNISPGGYIGCDNGTGGRLNGNIYEILIYKSFHSTRKRQQVEGYLAWKWNQQAKLPADHPYKNAAP
jgi:hypothetical protein